MTKEEARKLADEIEEMGYQAEVRAYYYWEDLQSARYDVIITNHHTGHTMVINSSKEWQKEDQS